jgi:hypothetical protein
MPRGDGTGPSGKGPRTGRGMGKCGKGGGGRSGNVKQGKGRTVQTAGTGYCVCPGCGEKIEHKLGMPCTSVKCPKCGSSMVRQ